MTRFPDVPEHAAPPSIAHLYRRFADKMGYPDIPSFVTTQGGSPSMLRGTCCLVENVMLGGNLPRETKELIFLAVAIERQCDYCREAHTACCRMLGVDDNIIETVRTGSLCKLPEPTREIMRFAIKCAAAPEELSEQDFDYLRQQELCQEEILEVIATSAVAMYATTIANAAHLEPDAMFRL